MANSMLKRILEQGDESGQLLYDKVEKQALMAALTLTTVEVIPCHSMNKTRPPIPANNEWIRSLAEGAKE